MMNNKIKSENHRKLSISVLVTSIIAISVVGLYNFFWMPIFSFIRNSIGITIIPFIV